MPSAGFVSTTADLVRFGREMREGSFVSADTLESLMRETTSPSRARTGYGLGWQWIDLAGHRAVGHGGSHVGATADLWTVPDFDLTVAVATNTNAPGGSLKALAEELVGGLIG